MATGLLSAATFPIKGGGVMWPLNYWPNTNPFWTTDFWPDLQSESESEPGPEAGGATGHLAAERVHISTMRRFDTEEVYVSPTRRFDTDEVVVVNSRRANAKEVYASARRTTRTKSIYIVGEE